MALAVNLLQIATNLSYAGLINSFPAGTDNVTFQSFDPSFGEILGPSPGFQLLGNETYKAFHEGGVYHQPTNSLYISSAWADDFNNLINVTIISLPDYKMSTKRFPGLASANGATTYIPPGESGPPQIIFCDKGLNYSPSAVQLLDPVKGTVTSLVNSYYGHNFSSINDIRQHHITGDLWFTDSPYGALQGFRPPPSTPNHVYRFEPKTGHIQVVADGFVMNNGLEFSPDFKTMYVSDTGINLVRYGGFNSTRPATIYAYDVLDSRILANKRLFAWLDVGLPDGMRTDTKGNLFVSSGSGDGVQVFSPTGKLLGKIRVEGGVSNFQFVPEGLVINNEYRLFLVKIAARGRELARDYGL